MAFLLWYLLSSSHVSGDVETSWTLYADHLSLAPYEVKPVLLASISMMTDLALFASAAALARNPIDSTSGIDVGVKQRDLDRHINLWYSPVAASLLATNHYEVNSIIL